MLVHRPLYFWIQKLLYLFSSIVLVLLFFLLPFQKRFPAFLSRFSDSMIPANIVLPDFFYRHIEFFPGDLEVFLLTLLVLLQSPKTLYNRLSSFPIRWLVLFCITAFFSLVFSEANCYLLQYIRLAQFSSIILLFYAIEYIVAQNKTDQLVKWIAWAILMTACVQFLIASKQYFSQSSIGLHKIGEPPIHWFSFPNPGKQRWVFDRLLHFHLPSSALCRATGVFSHPNIFGGFLFLSLLNTSYLYIMQNRKRIKCLLAILIFMHFFALSISFCRSAISSCAIGTIIWTLIQYFWIQDVFYKKEMKKLWVIFFVSTAICLGFFYEQFAYRGGIINYNQIAQHADKERIIYQKIALKMIQANPWFGIGFNNFQLCVNPIQYGHFLCSKVHNIYLLVAVETGIFGFIFFSAFLFSVAKNAIKHTFSQEQALFFSVFIGFLWIGCCDYYFMEQMCGRLLFFTSLALLNGFAQKTHAPELHSPMQKKVFLPKL